MALKKTDCKHCLISRCPIVFGLQNASELLNDLKTHISTLENSLTVTAPELSAANESVMENATKHAANLTAEAKQRQR